MTARDGEEVRLSERESGRSTMNNSDQIVARHMGILSASMYLVKRHRAPRSIPRSRESYDLPKFWMCMLMSIHVKRGANPGQNRPARFSVSTFARDRILLTPHYM